MSAKKAVSPQTAAERRAAEAVLATLIDRFAPSHVKLVAAMRRSLRKRLPTACEIIYEYRDCFVISISPSEHGYEGVLAIRSSEDGMKLYFNRGKDLPDPTKLLKGSSQTRWILVEAASTLARPEVVSLIETAIADNRVAFASEGRGSVILSPTASKKKPNPKEPS